MTLPLFLTIAAIPVCILIIRFFILREDRVNIIDDGLFAVLLVITIAFNLIWLALIGNMHPMRDSYEDITPVFPVKGNNFVTVGSNFGNYTFTDANSYVNFDKISGLRVHRKHNIYGTELYNHRNIYIIFSNVEK